ETWSLPVLWVLFSEPQAGIFVTTRSWLDGSAPIRDTLAVSSSIVTTTLIGITAARMRRQYRVSRASDRLIVVFALVLAANATLSFAYVKDDIMSVSGAFYALAAYAAVRHVAGRVPSSGFRVALLTLLLLALGTAWSVRSL